ncbi:YitT family protein [Ureibacillus aquaedulcis]|uniref:YitT family protein n=1 Tax=Ureibacillus aquaedulcis TaxID=3058421 RepID=A0ABT8GMH8_9BACL|nr:YitT family protein [Ureibacillus sp. BA0131]MDN4492606.1 YitT family protein [Ureibacillus sp. BA0131]
MMEKQAITTFLNRASIIAFGAALAALAFNMLLQPNDIMAPGLGGVVLLLNQFLPLSTGLLYFVLNIPLFLLGLRFIGLRFIFYSFMGMTFLSLFLLLFEHVPIVNQPVIGSIVGGLLSGTAIAIILLAGGSTGGLDIVCVIINRLRPKLTTGKVMFMLNAFIVLCSVFLFGITKSVLSILSIYLASKALDLSYNAGEKYVQRFNARSSQNIEQTDTIHPE